MIACLIKAGACDSLGGHRAQLLEALEDVVEAAATTQRERASGQTSLFELMAEAGDGGNSMTEIELPDVPPWSLRETLQQEKEQVGFYISGHPLDEYEIDFRSFATSNIQEFRDRGENGGEARLLGEIHKVSRRVDRNNRLMAFFEIEDFTGQIECIAFSGAHEQYGDAIQEDAIVYVTGFPNARNGDLVKCQVKTIQPAEDYRRETARWLEIVLDADHCSEKDLHKIHCVLQRYAGRTPVQLIVPLGPEGHRLTLECSSEYAVDPEIALTDKLRKLPGIKRLTYR
jgi:DNA polymerase-3 subunit alpha